MSGEKKKTEYIIEEDLWEPEICSEFQKSNNFVSDSDSSTDSSANSNVDPVLSETEPFIPDIPAFTGIVRANLQTDYKQPEQPINQNKDQPAQKSSQSGSQKAASEPNNQFKENIWSYKKEKERVKFAKQKYKEECRRLKKEKRQKSPGWKKIVGTGFICAITGGIISCAATVSVLSISAKIFDVDLLGLRPVKIIEKSVVADIKEYESNAEAVADKAVPSVVCLKINNTPSASIWGVQAKSVEYASGIVYSTDGYIITSFDAVKSVVEINGNINSRASVEVYLQEDTGKGYKAELIGYDGKSDVALLKIAVDNLTKIEFGDSDELVLGQKIYSIGCPGGIEYMGSINEGIISGLDRRIISDQVGDIDLIQTNIEYSPGSNGGALLDSQGKLIGINGKIVINKEYPDMGFSIPANRVKEVCQSIINDSE